MRRYLINSTGYFIGYEEKGEVYVKSLSWRTNGRDTGYVKWLFTFEYYIKALDFREISEAEFFVELL